jgi:hypothetical protein
MRGRPDKAVSAALTAQQAGPQVVGGVGGLGPRRVAALGKQHLRPLEQLRIDDGLVAGLMLLAIEGELPDVGGVAQHAEDAVGGPPSPASGGLPSVVEQSADGGRAESAIGVQGEDPLHQRRFCRHRQQAPLLGVVAVAKRRCPTGPLPPCRLAGQTHAGALHDHLALELGEHAQHLHHHAAGGGGGVERLGGRPKRDPGGVQILQHLGQPAGRPCSRSTLNTSSSS